ncbi:hypothetical protein HOC67_02635 [Candidatus Peregrinibacteria bacterium]|nr:hypothetical protein [Candidatus Peregrinibacteria bacterium]
MKKICTKCSAGFEITEEDIDMLSDLSPVIGGKKYEIPPPTLCPRCRSKRRLSHVNQLNLYERKCNLTGASIISNIRPELPYKVYRQEDWYSDKWDPLDYGMNFDFNRPFFEQWNELVLNVPLPNLFTGYEFDENCEYTNHAGKNQNCYLVFDSDEDRDCYYSYSINQCVNCMDCYRTRKSELCYECVDCVKCYESSFLQDCNNCSSSMFLKNCTGCKNCLMCSNMNNKEYFVENKKVSKEEFENFRSLLGSYASLKNAKERFMKLKLEYPQKYIHGIQNEDVVGDYLVNCKNAYMCFDSEDLWDCRYACQGFMPLKNCMDIDECGEAEKLYECTVCGYQINSCCFCDHTLGMMTDLLYCSHCPHTTDSFGCRGVQRKEYCILNKQYTKEEYEELVPRIINHMIETGEWGENFPSTTSKYAYNETMAQDHYPLNKEQAVKEGLNWLDDEKKIDQYMGPVNVLPDNVKDAPDDVCKKIYICEESGEPYKIIPQELSFYKELNLPLPRKGFFKRNKDRMKLRSPRKLYGRKCEECGIEFMTSYALDREEKIFCESCYQKALI